jgi:hypothetical protein
MNRKRLIIFGIVFVQLLLMGSAFVAGRMIGEQNLRANRPVGSIQLPAQLPRDPAAASGLVQRIQDNVITLGRGFGGQGGGQPSSSTQTEVVTTTETKFYKNVSSMQPGQFGQPGGQTPVQVTDATLADVKVGNNIIVWGTRNGGRVTAEVVYIQTSGR